jgi:Uma2 family endonuclease
VAVLSGGVEKQGGGRVLTEPRCRVAPVRYRIPDVCVMEPGARRERVLTAPPRIVIEILSPEDRLEAQLERLEDYRAWGVAHIWLADPVRAKVYEFARGLQEVESQVLVAELANQDMSVDFGALLRDLAKEA